ncbi:hypothetical protein ZWY2020_005760 [Hordeum vulgare]|nr:hypothetical protein ZWY2020_005760 [Hordeum vulgare]
MASSTFSLHPDFFINFFRHQTRAKYQAVRFSKPTDASMVLGCVVGTQRGPTAEIVDSLDIPARQPAAPPSKRKRGRRTGTHEIHKVTSDEGERGKMLEHRELLWDD